MSEMRILLVCEPGIDGAFHFVESYWNFLKAVHPECRVGLAYSSLRGGARQNDLVASVKRAGGPTLDLRVGNHPWVSDIPAIINLAQICRTWNPSLLHLHSSKAGALGRFVGASFARSLPILYTPHAYFGMARRGGAKERIFNIIERELGRFGHTHCCSADELHFAKMSLGIPEARLSLVNNGIDIDHFCPQNELTRKRLRLEFEIPTERPVLISVGRRGYQKNLELLYRSLVGELSQGGLFFVHVGKGSEKLASEHFGKVERDNSLILEHSDRISELLSAADSFVMTSRYEGYPLALLEAACCGLPPILTRVPGLAHFATRKLSGTCWIESSDELTMESQLREHIKMIRIEGDVIRRERGEKARLFANQRERFEELYFLSRQIAGCRQ